MSGLPTLVKTWQLAHNVFAAQGGAAGVTDRQHGLRLGVIGALLGLATNPPTVKGSSNSTTGAMDNTNRWTTDANLVWAAGATAHSWIVLQFQTGWQICFDLNTTSPTNMTIAVSPAVGFTGGSSTARPTATDEFVLVSAASWDGSANAVAIQRCWHVWMPTDGSAFRLRYFSANGLNTLLDIETVASPVSGWATPLVGILSTSTQSTTAPLQGVKYGVQAYVGHYSGGQFTTGGTVEAYGGVALPTQQTVVNAFDSGWPFWAQGLYSTTAAVLGFQGRLTDIWWGSVTRTLGNQYPGSGTTGQFIQIGQEILPWDQSGNIAVA